jgi:hypothetical protein
MCDPAIKPVRTREDLEITFSIVSGAKTNQERFVIAQNFLRDRPHH